LLYADGQTDMTKLIFTSRSFVTASKDRFRYIIIICKLLVGLVLTTNDVTVPDGLSWLKIG
jgi:hypothetical protein